MVDSAWGLNMSIALQSPGTYLLLISMPIAMNDCVWLFYYVATHPILLLFFSVYGSLSALLTEKTPI